MWRILLKKHFFVALFWGLFFGACSTQGASPVPSITATPSLAPIATATPLALDVAMITPMVTADFALMPECFGTLKGEHINFPICTRHQEQHIFLRPEECMTVEVSEEISIFILLSDGSEEKIETINDQFCNHTNFVLLTEMWAEPISQD